MKPEPAFYQLALQRAGCAPREAAFFDDLPEFVQAANALGIRGHLFTTAPGLRRAAEALGL